jgi:hypothetical protein
VKKIKPIYINGKLGLWNYDYEDEKWEVYECK